MWNGHFSAGLHDEVGEGKAADVMTDERELRWGLKESDDTPFRHAFCVGIRALAQKACVFFFMGRRMGGLAIKMVFIM